MSTDPFLTHRTTHSGVSAGNDCEAVVAELQNAILATRCLRLFLRKHHIRGAAPPAPLQTHEVGIH